MAKSIRGVWRKGMAEKWGQYRRVAIAELRPYEEGEDMTNITLNEREKAEGHPKAGDMVARDPVDHSKMWLITKAYYDVNFRPV